MTRNITDNFPLNLSNQNDIRIPFAALFYPRFIKFIGKLSREMEIVVKSGITVACTSNITKHRDVFRPVRADITCKKWMKFRGTILELPFESYPDIHKLKPIFLSQLYCGIIFGVR